MLPSDVSWSGHTIVGSLRVDALGAEHEEDTSPKKEVRSREIEILTSERRLLPEVTKLVGEPGTLRLLIIPLIISWIFQINILSYSVYCTLSTICIRITCFDLVQHSPQQSLKGSPWMPFVFLESKVQTCIPVVSPHWFQREPCFIPALNNIPIPTFNNIPIPLFQNIPIHGFYDIPISGYRDNPSFNDSPIPESHDSQRVHVTS